MTLLIRFFVGLGTDKLDRTVHILIISSIFGVVTVLEGPLLAIVLALSLTMRGMTTETLTIHA